MHGFDTYKMYIALKTHFSSDSYDYIKYNRKTNAKLESFLKRKDRFYFGRLENKYKDEVENYLISNFICDPKGWVGNFNEDNYKNWRKRQDSLHYTFQQDIDRIVDSSNGETILDAFTCKGGKHPVALKHYLGNIVSIDTMCIINKLIDYVSDWDRKISEQVVWTKVSKLFRNYDVFLNIDNKKYKKTILEKLDNE